MKKKKFTFWKLLLILLILVVIAAAGLYIAVTHYVSKLNFEDTSGEDSFSIVGSLADDATGVKNILLIGVDNDYAPGMDELGNADGLMIASINPKTRQVVLTSLMRDIRVQIPDSYKTKLTLSYHYGGTQQLIDTIEYNFGVPIDNYVLVNYISVVNIVDAVGGLTMDVTADELYWMDDKIRSVCELVGASYEDNMLSTDQAGELELNGIQTAAYLRIRYAGNNDFDRTERARRVVLGLKDKAAAMSLTELDSLANTVLPYITTDLTQTDIISLLLRFPALIKYDMLSDRIPVEGSYWLTNDENGAFVDIDYDANKEHLQSSIYGGELS